MSSTIARTSRTPGAGGILPTRQQLDELDALLQRMLDLPVQREESEAPAAPAMEAPRGRSVSEPPSPTPRLSTTGREARRSAAPIAPAPTASDEYPATIPMPSRHPVEPPSRSYPASYMVVESATPADLLPPGQQRPVREEYPTNDRRGAGSRPMEAPPSRLFEEPVPGGRHDLVEDEGHELPPRERHAGAAPRPDDWVPLRSTWQPSAQTWKPLVETWRQTHTSDATARPAAEMPPVHSAPVPVAPRPEPVRPASQPRATRPPEPEAPAPIVVAPPPERMAPEQPPPPTVLLPLVWFNQAFDLFLYPWGPLGRWLQGPIGRNLLGTLGLLCLCAAALVVLGEGIGWSW